MNETTPSPLRNVITIHGGSFLLSWLRLATTSSARFGAASPYLFVRKIPYVIECTDDARAPSDLAKARLKRSRR